LSFSFFAFPSINEKKGNAIDKNKKIFCSIYFRIKTTMSLQTSKLPKSYWKSIENRKNFLDEIAKKLNIKTPSDWGNVTLQCFYDLQGRSILKRYNNSLFACLQSVYKGIYFSILF
jgi:hypothetical protein